MADRRHGGMRRKKVCQFCADKAEKIDYKDVDKLRKYISERGKILPRRVTGTCALHQRDITVAVKRARIVALLPYVAVLFAVHKKESLMKQASPGSPIYLN